MVVYVEILESAGGADRVVGIHDIHIHKAHGLARADNVALGEDFIAADREKVVDIGASRDGGALLGTGKACGEPGGGVHDGADEAAVNLAVKVQMVGLDRHAHEHAVLSAFQQLASAVLNKAHHAVLGALGDLEIICHDRCSFVIFSQYSIRAGP